MKTNSNIMKNLIKCLNKDVPFSEVGKIMSHHSATNKVTNKTSFSGPISKRSMKANINNKKA